MPILPMNHPEMNSISDKNTFKWAAFLNLAGGKGKG